jgi:hypothetical protein
MNFEIQKALPFLLGACALTGSTLAQDSTSLLNTLPGDSVDPTNTTEQINNYVLDLAALKSTSGRVYGVAPMAKASQDFSAPNFFSAALSAQTISRSTKLGVPFVRSSYSSWNTAGSGINNDPTRNTPGTPIDTSTFVGSQFGFAFSQFSDDDPDNPFLSFNSIVGGTANFEMGTPSRLYVSRVQVANNDMTWSCNVSQFGMGAVDADGWLTLRADGYGASSCGGFTAPTGDNLFLINSLARTGNVINMISNLGASDTGVWALQNSGTTHGPASMIPSSLTGGTPILLGSNWGAQFVYGDSSPLTSTGGHFAGSVTDHRGLVSYTTESFPGIFGAGSTHGSGAILGKAGGSNTLSVWGLASTGAPVGPVSLTYPGNGAISDPSTGWAPAPGIGSFANYYSSTAFRGGTGQVAVGKDQAGRLIAVAEMNHPNFVSAVSTDNMLCVARTANGSSIQWVVAAYTEGSTGKPVYGDFGTNQVGTLVGYEPGASFPSGPAISCPMVDSVGNIYFNGRVLMNGESFFRDSLVRAVYNPASFEYDLELVLSEGDVVKGGNSNTSYQIDFLSIAGGAGSTPSAPYSQNINQSSFNGTSTAGLSTGDTASLGGIVISATIIYDTDGDGDYERQSSEPLSMDQDYQTLLFVTSAKDCNSNGIPDDLDIADSTSSDGDADGVPDECGAGIPFCLGDGTDVNCPCGNLGGPGEGCGNSTADAMTPFRGSLLFSTGTASVGSDDLGFSGSQLPGGKPCLLFSGNASTNAILGDGVRCVGVQIKRYPIVISSAGGDANWGPNLQSTGLWGSGDTRYFQIWYRDPSGSPCGNGFNLSSGVQVNFQP